MTTHQDPLISIAATTASASCVLLHLHLKREVIAPHVHDADKYRSFCWNTLAPLLDYHQERAGYQPLPLGAELKDAWLATNPRYPDQAYIEWEFEKRIELAMENPDGHAFFHVGTFREDVTTDELLREIQQNLRAAFGQDVIVDVETKMTIAHDPYGRGDIGTC
jgi:hypothetical protein